VGHEAIGQSAGGKNPTGRSGGTKNGGVGAPVTTDQKACNCTVPGGSSGRAGALTLLALFGLARRRRLPRAQGA
jgi:MYXO-CTERM domain-containing protein